MQKYKKNIKKTNIFNITLINIYKNKKNDDLFCLNRHFYLEFKLSQHHHNYLIIKELVC